MSDHPNGNGRRTRAVVLWAFAAVAAALVYAGTAVIVDTLNDRRLEAEQQCRARISNRAADFRDQQQVATNNGLALSVIERQQTDARAVAQRIRDLGAALDAASGVRSRSIEICADNPDFTPP